MKLAFRRIINPSCERYHEDKQDEKNALHIKVWMVEFKLRLDVSNKT